MDAKVGEQQDQGHEQWFMDPETGDSYYTISYYSSQTPDSDIVLVHGLLTNPRFWWRDQIEDLLRHGNVHCISLTGHHPSQLARPDERWISESFIVNMVARQLEYLGLTDRPITLIGHSTGGLVSLVFALHQPHRIRALGVLSSMSHGMEDAGIYRFFQILARRGGRPGREIYNLTLRLNGASRRIHRFLVGDVAYDRKTLFAYPGFDQWVSNYFPHVSQLDARQTLPWLRDLHDMDVTDRLGRIDVPVLLLCGENDPYVDCRETELTKARLSGAHVTCHVIRQAGHLCMFETPIEYRSFMGDWLASPVW